MRAIWWRSVTYDGAVAPVFKNTYTPPTTADGAAPNPPSKSPVPKEEKPGLPYTGDTSLSPMALGGIGRRGGADSRRLSCGAGTDGYGGREGL